MATRNRVLVTGFILRYISRGFYDPVITEDTQSRPIEDTQIRFSQKKTNSQKTSNFNLFLELTFKKML